MATHAHTQHGTEPAKGYLQVLNLLLLLFPFSRPEKTSAFWKTKFDIDSNHDEIRSAQADPPRGTTTARKRETARERILDVAMAWQTDGWSWSHHGLHFNGVFRTAHWVYRFAHPLWGSTQQQGAGGIFFSHDDDISSTAQRRRGFDSSSLLLDTPLFTRFYSSFDFSSSSQLRKTT